jgi:type I restriction enzyme S subunit
MTTARLVPLGEVVKSADPGFACGEHLSRGVVQLRMNNVTRAGSLDWSAMRRVPSTDAKSRKYGLAPGDVVFNHTNSPELVGKTALFTGFKEAVVYSNHFLRLRVDEASLYPRYLALWLNFQWKHRVFQRLCSQWVNQATVRRDDLLDLEIALPDLAQQKRIATVLEWADRLRRLRRYGLEMAETLLPATFLRLFGNPVLNSKGWPASELEEIALVDRGKFTPRPRNDPSYYGGPYPFFQTGDISQSGGRVASWTQTLNEKGKRVSRSFPRGTIVIAIVGATIGATAILDLEMYCPDSVVGIQVDHSKATTEYVEFLLRFWRPVFLAQAPETARANINLETLRPLRIPIPPIALQKSFSSVVGRVQNLEFIHREALRQAEHLFQTLLHRAFASEL